MKMNQILQVMPLAFCIATLWASDAAAVAVAVNYDHAGLTQVRIENGRLHYVRHTQRKFGSGELAPMRQNMTNYDRHEVVIWLTGAEVASVVKWMETRKVFDLPGTYPAKADKTYGSAFETSLSVTLEDRKHSINWNGDCAVTEELRAAEKELVQICEGIRKDRDQ
jgi:hypothetical protein